MTDPTHGPIEAEYFAKMNALAEGIDDILNGGDGPKKTGFVLLLATFGEISEGRVNYISNGQRADMIAMLKEMLARAEGRYPGKAFRVD